MPPSTEALRGELAYAREQTDSLFETISPEALYERPIAERHRLIFYLGHFEAFDWNVLARRSMSERAFHPEFDSLFERGIDPPPGRAPGDTASDWPSQTEVERYKSLTREWIDRHLEDLNPELLQMAIEHRQMHAETFAYMMHNLPYGSKRGPGANVSGRSAPANPMVRVDAGVATLGKSREGFGWDNEHLAHRVTVPGFAISKYKISNGEYLNFVREGGAVPNFWAEESGSWFYRGMFERVPLPLDQPVWVTWEQASAYAGWHGLSLATEAQFHLAAQPTEPDPARDNFGFHSWDPIAVDASNGGSRPSQMVGNGWEWTRDVFAPFEGFAADPFYPGYSADFFDGGHYVMKGASPRTARLLTRPSFRNWFRPEYPYVYAGFRMVED
ncbi:MAG TPA: SUMF1/EgtB/PvdO family nonheme iron enzyme [Bryobacteraceae bacterium]|nr:SUMF1/EgtB/PvdO family nonheme iron enzyme [Bryobacteraceae bacterium]